MGKKIRMRPTRKKRSTRHPWDRPCRPMGWYPRVVRTRVTRRQRRNPRPKRWTWALGAPGERGPCQDLIWRGSLKNKKKRNREDMSIVWKTIRVIMRRVAVLRRETILMERNRTMAVVAVVRRRVEKVTTMVVVVAEDPATINITTTIREVMNRMEGPIMVLRMVDTMGVIMVVPTEVAEATMVVIRVKTTTKVVVVAINGKEVVEVMMINMVVVAVGLVVEAIIVEEDMVEVATAGADEVAVADTTTIILGTRDEMTTIENDHAIIKSGRVGSPSIKSGGSALRWKVEFVTWDNLLSPCNRA
mmetsp:Transcript_15330/g.31643  ORF Transcript_15330/g.31643 Transcript_15330/m.31643 type:complete len:303 (+) Transcript_15330:1257-2165(+)